MQFISIRMKFTKTVNSLMNKRPVATRRLQSIFFIYFSLCKRKVNNFHFFIDCISFFNILLTTKVNDKKD